MKCVKDTKGDKFIRVQDSLAKKLVLQGWVYCPKQEWKTNTRDKKNAKGT